MGDDETEDEKDVNNSQQQQSQLSEISKRLNTTTSENTTISKIKKSMQGFVVSTSGSTWYEYTRILLDCRFSYVSGNSESYHECQIFVGVVSSKINGDTRIP